MFWITPSEFQSEEQVTDTIHKWQKADELFFCAFS